MASISTNKKDGCKLLQFSTVRGRKTIRLGVMQHDTALAIKRQVEAILIGDPVDLREIRGKLYQKLVRAGIVPPRYRTVDELLESWQSGADWSDETRRIVKPFVSNMRNFFGGKEILDSITPERAADFRDWLHVSGGEKGGRLARTSVSRRIGWARQMFQYAVRRKALPDNPFADFHRGREINRRKDFNVKKEFFEEIISSADDEFKALLSSVRYAGLRCPSEVLPLTWEQINWEDSTLEVYGPKNERYGQECRTVPLSPLLVSRFQVLREKNDGALVFPNYQAAGSLRAKLEFLCLLKGVKLWRKPFINMRATCETDWVDEGHVIHVVAAWMGHSASTALNHYLQYDKSQAARAAAAMREKETLENCC